MHLPVTWIWATHSCINIGKKQSSSQDRLNRRMKKKSQSINQSIEGWKCLKGMLKMERSHTGKGFHFKGSERNWKWLWESKKHGSYRSWTWPFRRTERFYPVLTASNPYHLQEKKACNESRFPHNMPLERMIHVLSTAYCYRVTMVRAA